MQIVDLEMARRHALTGAMRGLRRLKWHAAATRFELALRRHDRALKYGYNPDQPRVPAGDPAGGQWTSGGGSTGRMRLAGDVPTGDSPPDIPDKIPSNPRTKMAIVKAAAKWLARSGGPIGVIIKPGSWADLYRDKIEAYRDPPKSLNELQEAVSTPRSGYEVHHIIEQTAARQAGYSNKLINDPQNLVRIPTLKHYEITGWFMTPIEEYEDESPRAYLRQKSWPERRRIGIRALIEFKAIKE
jgi:hypothetical protein